MSIYKNLDWLSATRVDSDLTAIMPPGFTVAGVADYTAPYFDITYRLQPAGAYSVKKRESAPALTMIDWRGSDLTALRDSIGDVQIDALVKHCTDPDINVTRVDYCIDELSTELDPLDFLTIWQYGYAATHLRNAATVLQYGATGGETVYFGSPKSDRRLRIYDKAAQMKILEQAWLRVELQTRKPRANVLIDAMASQGIPDAGDTAIIDYIDFRSIPAFLKMLTSEQINLEPLPRKIPAWHKWMNEQVLRSIELHADNLDDNVFLQEWLTDAKKLVMRHYRQILQTDTLGNQE